MCVVYHTELHMQWLLREIYAFVAYDDVQSKATDVCPGDI